MKETDLKAIRAAVANYMGSEGCSCCRNIDAHREHKTTLGKLLKLPIKKNWFGNGVHGYDFSKYQKKEKK